MGGRTPSHNKYYVLIHTLKLTHPVFISSDEIRISHTLHVASHINRSITISWPVPNKFLERCKPNTIHLKRLEDSFIRKLQQRD
jgi:hypothetical protein